MGCRVRRRDRYMRHEIENWKWFGNAGHFICGDLCRFHLATQVGPWLVSTVGQMFPDEGTREVFATSRGVELSGRGDARKFDYMQKIGYQEIGCGRTFETMVFRAGDPCASEGCQCGLPNISGSELESDAYNDAGSATNGHMALCLKWADIEHSD